MKAVLRNLTQVSQGLRSAVLRKKLNDIKFSYTIAPFCGCQVWVGYDNKIERAIFQEGPDYDYCNFTLIQHLVKPGYVCLDVGANIGIYSVVLSKLSGQSENIHSFEPVDHIRAKLKANLKLNGFVSAHINDFALGESEETIEMYQVKEGVFRGGTSSFVQNENIQSMGQDCFDVKPVLVKKLDGYIESLNLSRLDFIKIDVEGFELNVMKGGVKTLSQYKPYILFEYDEIRHAPMKGDFMALFREVGYDVYEFHIVAGTPVLNRFDFSKNPIQRNLICVPKE